MPTLNQIINVNHPDTVTRIELSERDGVPGALLRFPDETKFRGASETKKLAEALLKAAEVLDLAEKAMMLSTFQRGEDETNETCLVCKKHISRHYGGDEYRCFPDPSK